VAFLSCASALQPILPKSQSWCVDGESTFVLQIRKPQYWRIEVPNSDEEEKVRVKELKVVLSKVLLFEKTPCPFQRDFVVELPEAPTTPITKRPWRPVQGPQLFSSPSYGRKSSFDDDAKSSRASSPRGQSPAARPQVRPRSPQRPPTPMLSPSKSTLSADGPIQETQTSKPSNPSPPHSPMTTPPPGSPMTPVERALPKTPLRQTSITTSPPRTPDSSATSRAPIISRPSFRADAHECLPPVREEGIIETSECALKKLVSLEQPTLAEYEANVQASSLDIEDDNGFTSENTDDSNDTPTSIFPPECQPHVAETEIPERPQAMRSTARSTTAPPLLSLITSPPSKARTKSPLRESAVSATSSSQSSTVGSFHSLHSWHSPLEPDSPGSPRSSSESPSYPYPHENIILPKRSQNRRETALVVETPGAWKSPPASEEGDSTSMCLSPHPETPITNSDANIQQQHDHDTEAVTPAVEIAIRHRATTSNNSRRRELSPLPAAVNLFSPPPTRRSRRLQTTRHLPTAIIQKTCEILLSPPSHLFTLMISVASKIAAGEWRGFLFSGYGEEVHWDFEDEYGRSSYSPEDDYGVALPHSNLPRKPKSDSSDAGGSWEVD
jgi:hypothetical protein